MRTHICTHQYHTQHIRSTRGIVILLGRRAEFCLSNISGVCDINAMLMKPLTPSLTCLFHLAEIFKHPWGAANTVAHNENMFVKIKSIVVSMSKASMQNTVHPRHYLLLWSTSPHNSSLPLHHLPHNSVSEHSHKAHLGVMHNSPLLSLYACTVCFIFHIIPSYASQL